MFEPQIAHRFKCVMFFDKIIRGVYFYNRRGVMQVTAALCKKQEEQTGGQKNLANNEPLFLRPFHRCHQTRLWLRFHERTIRRPKIRYMAPLGAAFALCRREWDGRFAPPKATTLLLGPNRVGLPLRGRACNFVAAPVEQGSNSWTLCLK